MYCDAIDHLVTSFGSQMSPRTDSRIAAWESNGACPIEAKQLLTELVDDLSPHVP